MYISPPVFGSNTLVTPQTPQYCTFICFQLLKHIRLVHLSYGFITSLPGCPSH
ncbi:hypothetical protein OE88DRAFT_1666415 [Heliocybe sulcata]|uniref:Uncharacterized protein n=1 Tax=Heliocybe sulcata TaxID=5364 RepID=A0A5C3MQN1_9AGAM|nr:hypothetical protein OE88DRAFT_1666415 [Heliocybe sulcata]